MLDRFKRLWQRGPVTRSPEREEEIRAQAAGWSLYYYDGCGFCSRVRRAMRGLGLEIELRDILRDPGHRQDLLAGGGRTTVPCLRIPGADGAPDVWMYESADIVAFLESRFAPPE